MDKHNRVHLVVFGNHRLSKSEEHKKWETKIHLLEKDNVVNSLD